MILPAINVVSKSLTLLADMAMQNQLLFNLDVPPEKANMAIRCYQPQPFVVVKCDSEPGIPCDVSGISQQVGAHFD